MLVFLTIDNVFLQRFPTLFCSEYRPTTFCFYVSRTPLCMQFPVNFHIAFPPHLPQRRRVFQAKQYIIVSITVSHRNDDIDPEYLIAVLSVMVRYATGIFSDTVDAVTENPPTRLWAAVSLERGFTNNRLHVQGAGLVRSCMDALLCCLYS
jgi:hypothetical protein